jgi:hypothetical protein
LTAAPFFAANLPSPNAILPLTITRVVDGRIPANRSRIKYSQICDRAFFQDPALSQCRQHHATRQARHLLQNLFQRHSDVERMSDGSGKATSATRMRIRTRLKLNTAVRTDHAKTLFKREVNSPVQRHRAFRNSGER